MAGLIALTDLDARKIEYEDDAQGQAAINDASAVAREVVAPELDAVETPDAPDLVVAAVVSMVRRALANPRGVSQESLGDYSYAMSSAGVATLLPTARERKLLRRAVGKMGVAAVNMIGDLPVQPSEDGRYDSPPPGTLP